jgi:hypothetical protein
VEPEANFDGCQVVAKRRQGPIADLYEAIQQPLGRRVLVKALSSSILPSSPFAATLEREARLLAELDHPNIVHVYDFVRRDDRMWLVLEHVDGWTLEELLRRLGRFPPPAAAALGTELARALDHAHRRGVIHRDVQPRNVLVSRRGRVKLVNFAVAVDDRLPTAPELLDGDSSFSRPAYMSPEQLLGEPADPRSDLFSLGIVLYELLSGKRPFDAPDERTATQRIRHEVAAPLARSVPGVRASLERAVQHCLEKMPADRFRSAAELHDALSGVLEEYSAPSSRELLGDVLARAGLVDEAPNVSEHPREATQAAAEAVSIVPFVRGLVACFLLVVAGGAVLHYLSARDDTAADSRRGGARLELLPPQAAYLRVVVDPWAHVIVDGQKVDTTPFARPIPLRAGTHYVRLEHPDAPTERRTVRLVPGETALLDVKMRLYDARLAPTAAAAALAPAPDAGPQGADGSAPSP